jgi:hypothetical protein
MEIKTDGNICAIMNSAIRFDGGIRVVLDQSLSKANSADGPVAVAAGGVNSKDRVADSLATGVGFSV